MKYKVVKNLQSYFYKQIATRENGRGYNEVLHLTFIYHCCHDDGLVTALTRADNFLYFAFLKIYNVFRI